MMALDEEGTTCPPLTARELLALLAGMSVIALAMTWPLAAHARDALPGDLADPLLNTFTLAWDADRLAHGLRGLWDAPVFFPLRDTLAFSDHLLGIAVFTAPIQWLSHNPVLAYNLAFIASYVLAGVGAYLLARSLWGSRTAAWIAAIAFAAAPHRALHVSHVQILASGWLPLSLWGLHEYFRSRRRAASSGTIDIAEGRLLRARPALVVFSGSYLLLALSSTYLMYLALVPISIVVAAGLFSIGGSRADTPARPAPVTGVLADRFRAMADLAVSALVVAMALAPTAAAYLRVRQATGLRRTLGEMTMFSARALDYLRAPVQLAAWGRSRADVLPERMLFPGIAVVVLAGVALAAALRWRRSDGAERTRTVITYGVVLGLAGWLSAGPGVFGPYRWLVALLPGFDGLRVPARFVVIVALALAVLAGRGALLVVEKVADRRRAFALTVAFSAALLVEGWAAPVALAPFDAAQHGREALNAWLRASPPGGVLELPVAGPRFEPFTTTYQFNALLHRHPVVNGYTGIGYGLQDFLASPTSPLARLVEVPAAIAGLRQVGVRGVVLHAPLYEQWQGTSAQALIDAIDGDGGSIVARARFGDATVWRLADAPPHRPAGDGRIIEPSRFVATASAASGDVRLALDGSTTTAWTTGTPKSGDEWFQLAFDRERPLASVTFRSGRSLYAGRALMLAIDSIRNDGSVATLFDGSFVPQIMKGLVRATDGAVIPLPANSTRILRLRQTGRGGRMPWTIEEVEVRESRWSRFPNP